MNRNNGTARNTLRSLLGRSIFSPTMAPSSTNCFVCYAKPLVRFGCIGMTPMLLNCPHSKNATTATFKISSFFLLLTFTLAVSVMAIMLDDLRLFSIVKMNYVETLMALNECTFCFVSYTFLIYCCLLCKHKAKELQGLAEIIKKGARYGIQIFSLKFIVISKCCVYFCIFISVAFETMSLISFIQSERDVAAVKAFISGSTFLLGCTGNLHYYLIFTVYWNLFKRVHLRVKSILNCHLYENLNCENGTFSSLYRSQKSFLEQLNCLRRMHSSIFFNFLQMGKCLSPISLIWCVTGVVMQVITNLFVIRCIQHPEECVQGYMLQVAKVHVHILITNILLFLVENNTKVVSDKQWLNCLCLLCCYTINV